MTDLVAGQYTKAGPPTADANTDLAIQVNAKGELIVVGDAASPIPVTISGSVGSIVWTQTPITLNGSSQTALAANPARKGLIVSNRVGNAQISYNISGVTVTLINGLPLLGGVRDGYTDDATPLTAITVIGTNTQLCDLWEGV